MSSYLFATNNQSKVKELQAMFREANLEMTSLAELGLAFIPEETGATFEENALLKATETSKLLNDSGHDDIIVLADDSGIVIDALDGAPGVDSAIYMGADTPYPVRNAKILELMKDVPPDKRGAKFVCVIACVMPDGTILATRGELVGEIAREMRGESGFGYDPIFFVLEYGKTAAELSQDEKNKVSHRGIALREMLGKLGRV